ncbi:DUF3667 domain-containing protein [Sphingomicrobium lutaoense]|uniref:DUF3667 domain-containing protein n=1 Tax=Sphingomicrobium lutaoense TaxID=515949 RepID=A0A839YZ98_9SPHN|nr:DUF3667 domain-containing protein [Sphingomicrobium lutaoense]MBB3764459.1 hypothetical protein [Sphingomicrobium lutaoense]
MSELEAAAEVAGGAMLGRAVEPVSDGKGGEVTPGPGDCLNCAAPLEGHYCSNCGQKVQIHRTLGGLVHDIVHGVLHLDGKFWNTLPLLVWRPGKLTRRYVAGQRARFISPIAFYLFTVVAMFALVVSVGDVKSEDVTFGGAAAADTIEEQEARIAGLEEALAELEEQQGYGTEGIRTGLEAALETAEEQLEVMRAEDAGIEPPPARQVSITSSDSLKPLVEEQFEKARANPGLFLYKVQTKAYKLSWLLIPLSLPFLWLLFPFSRTWRMYDHAVFITYSISFMMLLVIAVGIASRFGFGELAGVAALFYAPFHMFRQLRGTYGLSRLSALVRTVLLILAAFIVLALFAALMLVLGAVG